MNNNAGMHNGYENGSNFEQVYTNLTGFKQGPGSIYNHMFFTEHSNINGPQAVITLNNKSLLHAISAYNNTNIDPDLTEIFVVEHRYLASKFQGIIPDTGASSISTARKEQVEALQREHNNLNILIDTSTASKHNVHFSKGNASSLGTIVVPTPIGTIRFQVLPTNTPFLLCLKDMDDLKVKFDNITNMLVKQDGSEIPITRKWGHPFLQLKNLKESIIECHLTEIELRRLHRRFGHPSVQRLVNILRRAKENFDQKQIEHLVKHCHQCQAHSRALGRFKFTIRDENIDFNAEIMVDVMYLEGQLVLHVVDVATAFQAARFLTSLDAKSTWEAVRQC